MKALLSYFLHCVEIRDKEGALAALFDLGEELDTPEPNWPSLRLSFEEREVKE